MTEFLEKMHQEAGQLSEQILLYFDSYKLATIAPLVFEIRNALIAAHERGRHEGFEAGKEWAREMIRG